MRAIALVSVALGLVLAACSSDVVDIHAESTSGTTSHATGTGGSGGHGGFGGQGGQGGMGGHGGMMLGAGGAGGSTGAGAGGAAPARILTADTDIAQLVSGVAPGNGKLVDGPFVLTEVHIANGLGVSVVLGSDCAATANRHQMLGGAPLENAHGMRYFLPAGSALCNDTGYEAVFSGFRPY